MRNGTRLGFRTGPAEESSPPEETVSDQILDEVVLIKPTSQARGQSRELGKRWRRLPGKIDHRNEQNCKGSSRGEHCPKSQPCSTQYQKSKQQSPHRGPPPIGWNRMGRGRKTKRLFSPCINWLFGAWEAQSEAFSLVTNAPDGPAFIVLGG
jgi:hypothetical protein